MADRATRQEDNGGWQPGTAKWKSVMHVIDFRQMR